MRPSLLFVLLFVSSWVLGGAAAQDNPLPITEDVLYTVRINDTLDTIGALFDVSPPCIQAQNELERPSSLRVGQELLISVSCPRYDEDPRYNGQLVPQVRRQVVTFENECDGYVVQMNDSIELIGLALDISAESLLLTNGLTRADSLAIGECLVLPDDAPPFGVFPPIDAPTPGRFYSPEVATSLDAIARELDVSYALLARVNGISNPQRDVILPTTVLLIPDGAPAYGEDDFDPSAFGVGGGADLVARADKTHVVQPRETLDGIAAFYDVDTSCLAAANDLIRPGQITPGLVLVIDEECPQYVGAGVPPLRVRPAADAEADSGG